MSPDCDYPEINKEEEEIIRGLVMGDGCVAGRGNRTPYLILSMVNEDYIDYISDKLSKIVSSVSVVERDRTRKTAYRLVTHSHPFFEKFAIWYSSGEKRYPNNISLTPTTLKHWFAGDGTKIVRDGRQDTLRISCHNEKDRRSVVDRMFERIGIEPSWTDHRIRFGVEQSERLWEYMGSAPPGFGYKWNND